LSAVCLSLAACAAQPPVVADLPLAAPPAGTMAASPPVPKLPDAKPMSQSDFVQYYAKLRDLYGKETSRYWALRAYVRRLQAAHGQKTASE